MPANLGNSCSSYRNGKGQLSFQSQRRSMPNNLKLPHNCTCFTCQQCEVLKILQARLQKYINSEFPDVQARFRKGRGTRDQITNICQIIERTREFQKNIYICFTDCTKAFDYVDHNKLWKILQEMGIPDYLTCLLRNPYTGQESTV